MSASLQLPGGLKTLNPQPEIARYYNLAETAYITTGQVLSEIVPAARYVGQTFLIGNAEYWFNPTTADADLKIKATDVTTVLSQTIIDGDTTHAPSGDAVFDALALKVSNIVAGTNISINSFDPQNPIISAIPATSAGIFDRVYFTGQVASVATPVAPNYDTIRNGKGSVASVTLISPAIVASSKVFFTNDMIGPAQTVAGSLPTGNFSSFLSVLPSATASLKRFTIEVFLCDNAGVIIPQAGPPSTDPSAFYAGKNTVVILDSGNLTLPASNTSVGLSGFLTTPLNVAVGQRFRYHISVARGAGGGAQTMNVNIGNTWNSYTEAPIPLTTSTIINTSLVPGATATDALNALLATSHSPVTIGTANGLSLATQVLSLALASTSTVGALSAVDWNTFNNKQPLLTNPITGIGADGQVAFFTGANTQAGDAGFVWNNTNKELQILNNSVTPASIKIRNDNADVNGGTTLNFDFGGTVTGYIRNQFVTAIGVFQTKIFGSGGLLFRTGTGGSDNMIITSNGNVGIGTSPTHKLTVSGDIAINNTTGTLYSSHLAPWSGNLNVDLGGSGNAFIVNGGNVGVNIPSGNPLAKLHVYSQFGNEQAFRTQGAPGAISTSQSFFDNGAVNLGAGFGALLIGGDNSDGSFQMQTTTSTGSAPAFFRLNRLGGITYIGSGTGLMLQVQGNIQYSGTIAQGSDIRVKKNIKPLQLGIDTILKLKPCTFDRIDTKAKNNIGFIAQEVGEILPELIHTSNNPDVDFDDFKSLDTNSLIPILVKAIQELKAEINELKEVRIN